MDNGDEVKVLGFSVSPYTLRVLIGLEEKGIKYEFVEEDRMNKSPLLLQMNPVHKKVPVLIHNGRPVIDSSIILQYIDETWSNGPTFLPSDSYDRATARFWVDFIENKICNSGGRSIALKKGEEQEKGKREYMEGLAILEETLKGNDYFGGSNFGIVDIALVPQICWLNTLEIVGNFKIMVEDKFPNIFAWMKRCMERESVKKVLPQQEQVLNTLTQTRKFLFGEL